MNAISASRWRDTPADASGSLRLGSSLLVNRMGFGAMRVTGRGIWGPPRDRGEAVRVLRRAVELGINLIDTADSYGPDVSEELIAEALHPYPEGLVIATKGGLVRPGTDQWVRNCRPSHLRRACEGSLRRLRVDCIDLYQLHSRDPEVPYEDSIGELARLQGEGKIRLIGVSNVDVEALEVARRLVMVASVQNRYNLGDRASEDVLKACERHGLAFLPWYPLAAGPLAQATTLERIAQRYGATPAQVALSWLLRHSPVTVPIPGTSRVDHLEQNVAAASLRLDDDDLRALENGA